MKNRIVVALLIALALAAVGPPLVAAPAAPQQPIKVYTAAALPAPAIITGDLAITFPGLEESIAKVVGDGASLYQQQKGMERLLLLVLIFSAFPVIFIIYLLVNELISRRKAASIDKASKSGSSRSRQPPTARAKRTKRAAAKPKAPVAAPAEGS